MKTANKKRTVPKKGRLAASPSLNGSARTSSPQSSLEAAYKKFKQTKEGTPEHEKAGDELVNVLFADAK